MIYVSDTRDRQANKIKFDERIDRLNDWWGAKKLDEINGPPAAPTGSSAAARVALGEISRTCAPPSTITARRVCTGG
jgi:hypothetical protein